MISKLKILGGALVTLALGVAPAAAEGALGIGAELQLNGTLGGVSANYDLGEMHVGGFLGFSDDAGDDNTDIAIGGRFYYHLHTTASADFGLGGGLGIGLIGDRAPGVDADATVVFLEPGFQIRAFIAQGVALSFSGGLSLGLADADGVELTAQPNGVAGVHYYFN